MRRFQFDTFNWRQYLRSSIDPSARNGLRPDEVHDTWRLENGTAITLRAVRSDDGEIMQTLIRGLSPTSRYRRFFYPAHELTPDLLARFSHADPMDALTLPGVTNLNGKETAVGMAQYMADPYTRQGEFAVVTADAWQRTGIATRLIRNLVCIARAAGLTRIEGDVLAENIPMRQLLVNMDFAIASHPDGRYLLKAYKELQTPAWKCSPLYALASKTNTGLHTR